MERLVWIFAAAVVALGCSETSRSSPGDRPANVGHASQALGVGPEANCTPFSYGAHDYWFCPTLRSWSTARTKCEAQGYNLVRIESGAENAFVKSHVGLDSWTGGNDTTTEGTWKWTFGGSTFWTGSASGAPFGGLFSNWGPLQPDNLGNQDCAKMAVDGRWFDESCTLSLRYVCESGADECLLDSQKVVAGVCGCGVPDVDSDGDGTMDCKDSCPNDATKTDPGDCGCSNSPRPAGTACDDGLCAANTACNGSGVCGNPAVCTAPDGHCRFGVFQNAYYWACDDDRTFTDALQRCQNVGMTVASVESALEDQFLSTKTTEHTFLAANDAATAGTWVWTMTGQIFWTGGQSGSAVAGAYANWEPGQPNTTGNQHCMVKDPPLAGGQWEAQSCTTAEAFACERTVRLAATPTGTAPTTPAVGPFAAGAVDATTGNTLTTTATTVVLVAPDGTTTTAATYTAPHRFDVSSDGTRFGVYTPTQFEVRSANGALINAYARQPMGYGELVPGTNLVFLPELDGGSSENAHVTHARFFEGGALRSRFAAPDLSVSRVTSTHLVYATPSTLVRTTVDGVESWHTALALKTFEISANGKSLIGVIEARGNSQIVHVDLATGAVSPVVTLGGVFWNVAIAPGGRFSVATTKTAAHLFDAGKLSRRVDLPVFWAVSVDVSDDGNVAVGGQQQNHDALVVLLGGGGLGTSTFTRAATNDGQRPYVRFHPTGQKLIVNESSGLSIFDVKRAL